jgi:hypothetical protein
MLLWGVVITKDRRRGHSCVVINYGQPRLWRYERVAQTYRGV